MFDCNTSSIEETIWEKTGNDSGVLFLGLRSVRKYDLDNIAVSSANYSIVISPVRVTDEGSYICAHQGNILAEYNLSVKGINISFRFISFSSICSFQCKCKF